MIELMKHAFTHPEKLSEATKLPKRKAFLYLLILSAIMVLPFMVQANEALTSIHEDGQEIAESIPDFHIDNGQLVMENSEDEESFIHQTDTFLLFFDPEGRLTTESIELNRQRLGIPFGIGVMENKLYLSLLTYDISFPYSQFGDFTGADLQRVLNTVGTYDLLYGVLLFLVFFVVSVFNMLYEVLLYTLFANLIAIILRKNYRFGQNWKIITAASTVPVIVFAVINTAGFYPLLQFELKGLATLMYYYLAVKSTTQKNSQA